MNQKRYIGKEIINYFLSGCSLKFCAFHDLLPFPFESPPSLYVILMSPPHRFVKSRARICKLHQPPTKTVISPVSDSTPTDGATKVINEPQKDGRKTVDLRVKAGSFRLLVISLCSLRSNHLQILEISPLIASISWDPSVSPLPTE